MKTYYNRVRESFLGRVVVETAAAVARSTESEFFLVDGVDNGDKFGMMNG